MYKVLLVENDAALTERLKTMIDWESNGFMICGQAKDSFEALQMVRRNTPDTAIIDFSLPITDGLSLSEMLKNEKNDIEIVLIADYSGFEYAKKAIRLDIVDYLMKPVDKNELVSALLRLKNKLQKRRDESASRVLMREQALYLLLEKGYSYTDEQTAALFERLGITLKGNLFMVSVAEIDNLYQNVKNMNDILEYKRIVLNLLNNTVRVKGSHVVFNGPENKIVSIIGFNTNEDIDSFKAIEYQRGCDFVLKYFGLTVTIGIGTAAQGYKYIRDSYLEAQEALRNKVLFGMGRVLLYSDIKPSSMNLSFYPYNINEKLIGYLRLNDSVYIEKELKGLFDYCIQNKLSLEYIYATIMSLQSVCLSYITEKKKNIRDVLGPGFSPMQIINEGMCINAVDP